ncbi:MAG: nuclear transport factor 2 family protein [Pseudomonadales bacterium]|nr:nuclear transport factor 2 family protein [Pseudomonadales bacterium]
MSIDMPIEEKNEQLVRTFFDTLSTGDLEKVRVLLHRDACWTAMPKDVPGAGPHPGRDHIIDEFLAPVRDMFVPGDPKIDIKVLFAKGNQVHAETRAFGTFRNGRAYDNNYCWGVDIKDGLIYALREYMDSHYIMNVVN